MPHMRKRPTLAPSTVAASHDPRRAPRTNVPRGTRDAPQDETPERRKRGPFIRAPFDVTMSGRAPARMFHVERSRQHRERRDRLATRSNTRSVLAECRRVSNKVFHVEHRFQLSARRILLTRSPIDQGLRAPTRRSRRKEFGTAIGSCHSQEEIFRISGSSWDPIHKTTVLVASCSECAQSKNAG